MQTYDTTMAARFRTALQRRALRLADVLHHESEAAQDDAQAHEVGDFKDAAAQESMATVDEAQAANAAHEIQQIQEALTRLQDGSYGLCLDCGDPIDLRRLEALPAAAFCAACQSVRERR